MANCIYNGIELPALPDGLNEFNYILRSGDIYYLASATAEEKTINEDGTVRVSSDEGIFYSLSDDAWVENNNDNAIGYVVWCDTDVYNSDGTLYLAASDPIPVSTWTPDPASLLMGYRVGQILRAMRNKKREPVAYLYNGVRLPKLPEWDKTVYPYACIFHTPNDDTLSFYNEYAYLLVSTEPVRSRMKTLGSVSVRVLRIYNAHSGLCYHYGWDIEDTHEVFDSFVRYPTFDLAADSGADLSSPYFESKVIWANHDIINNDDETVYLAASEPVPVYE